MPERDCSLVLVYCEALTHKAHVYSRSIQWMSRMFLASEPCSHVWRISSSPTGLKVHALDGATLRMTFLEYNAPRRQAHEESLASSPRSELFRERKSQPHIEEHHSQDQSDH